jgi:hypothetical protein
MLNSKDLDILFKTLYVQSVKKINILINQYKKLVTSRLENKKIDNKHIFIKGQTSELVYEYLCCSVPKQK